MEKLGRHVLSIILSYLSEVEGTCFLITKKKFATQLLPRFELKDGLEGLKVSNAKKRHRYQVWPVQDPETLLARLNTRKLCRRRIPKAHGMTTIELANVEWNTNHCSHFPPELQLLRFLNGNGDRDAKWRDCGISLLVSYPRSGNSLLRTILERITGVVTGSDTRPDRNLSRELAEEHDLVGEGVTQSSYVCFVKTHWPERVGTVMFRPKRAILLVRNPFDAIDSYWNMNATLSHTKTLDNSVYERFMDKFEALVKNEIDIWLKFQDHWMRQSHTPILVVRYEDLILKTRHEVERIMSFSLGCQDLPPYWVDRVNYVTRTSETVDSLGSYRPRSALSGGQSIGKSLRKGRYTKELIEYIHRQSQVHSTNYLKIFGYDVDDQEFPSNFLQGSQPVITSLSAPVTEKEHTHGRVNEGSPVRPYDCPFGRALQAWRHSVTDHDRNPLPTAP